MDHSQELSEKGIEEFGRFLKKSEIFADNPWEARRLLDHVNITVPPTDHPSPRQGNQPFG